MTQTVRLPFPALIDSTIRADFVSCPHKCFFAYVKNLRLKASNIHLHFGGCFAKGLEVFRIAYYGDDAGYSESFARGCKAIILEWGNFEGPADHNKNLASCLVAFLEYFNQYPPHSDLIKPLITDNGPAVEFSFALPIPGILHPETHEPLLYAGRFDMLANFRDAVFVNDEKTCSQLGPTWNAKWRLRAQLTGYYWAAKQFGYPVQGVIVRGVCILKKIITHQMVIEQRPNWDLDRWLEQLIHDVKRMIRCWEDDYWDYNLDDTCNSYRGCPYTTLCTSPNPEPWEATHYTKSVWSPLHTPGDTT